MGLNDSMVLGAYIFYTFIYATASYPLGYISDKFNFKYVYLTGLAIFSLVYSLFAFNLTPTTLFLVFGLFGIFSATDDGISKAWLSLHVPSEYKATGLGLNLTINSLAFLVASVLTALLWQNFGAQFTFTLISLGGFLLVFYFLFFTAVENQPVK